MSVNGWLQIACYSVVLLLVTKPVGIYLQVLDAFAGQAAVAVERVRAMRAEAAESATSG